MAHIPIVEMQSGVEIKQFFLLRKREERQTKKGDPYWDVTLNDATGTLKGKVWTEALSRCQKDVEPGSVVGVQGTVQVYQEDLQLAVRYLADVEYIRAHGGDVSGLDMSLLLARSPMDIDAMWEELLETVNRSIVREELKTLLLSILENHAESFREAPAALLYHHAYMGGLLEHTLMVLRSVLAWYEWERKGDLDVMIAGAILHDVGKIREIEGMGVYESTVEGRLLGHLIQGRDLLRAAAAAMDFSDGLLLMQIEHVILSHHGELEYGSPIVPKTREAFVVHSMDDLNAKLKMIDDEVEKHGRTGGFTDYHRVLKRKLYTGRPADRTE